MLAQLKKHLTPHELWEDAKFFFLLNLGLVATAVGIAVFKTPNHFAFGGTSGLSIVLATLFPRWNVGAFMWFINAALVVLGFVFLGIRSMGWTIYSSFALSFYVSLCERVCPLSAPLTSDAFLELCFAVILSAVGAAIVFNIGASTGGTDIVAMILNKYTSMPVGRALMVSDLGIVLVGAYLYGPATGLYCILGMILKSTVADSAIESINLRKVCTVVTSNPQPVRDFIVNDLHRSATMEQAEGAYTHDEKWVLTTVLTRGQAQKLRLPFADGTALRAHIECAPTVSRNGYSPSSDTSLLSASYTTGPSLPTSRSAASASSRASPMAPKAALAAAEAMRSSVRSSMAA